MDQKNTPDNKPENSELIRSLTEEKNNLLKIISHDIRSPFNQLFALLQMLEMESEEIPERQREYIDKMYQAILGGMEMIKNLHDARSLDNGNISLNPEKLFIKKIIFQSVRNFTIQTRIKKITIDVDDTGPDTEITADKILLVKVLDIALSNAIKFSEPGKKVSISNGVESQKAVIQIIDQGPGLSNDELPLIFNKFQKLTPKPTLSEATTGLGMYLARKFMIMMGGEIIVDNSLKAGLNVKIKI